LNNIYALLYLIIPGGGGSVTYNFKNTKIFNPTSQTARIFYTQDYASLLPLGGSGNVKVAIFAINGSPVRTFDFQNKNALFNNGEPNFNNLSEVNYYFTWDGKNDKGKTVLNGIYIIKIEITTAAGVKSRLSRAIAVVK
jgi:flagellar hook assembly protein FlgD